MNFRETEEEATTSSPEHRIYDGGEGWTRCTCGSTFYNGADLASHFYTIGYDTGWYDFRNSIEGQLPAPTRRTIHTHT